MKLKRLISSVVCLFLTFLIGGASAMASPLTQEPGVGSYPSSAVFDDLWVGDFIAFEGHSQGAEPQASFEIISGDNVEIIYDYGKWDYVYSGLYFTKPGKAVVKVTTVDWRNDNKVEEETFTFTVAQRPEDKPISVIAPETKKFKVGDVLAQKLVDYNYRIIFKNMPYGLVRNANLYMGDPPIAGGYLLSPTGGSGGVNTQLVGEKYGLYTVEPDKRDTVFGNSNEWYWGFDLNFNQSSFIMRPGTISFQPNYLGKAVGNPVNLIFEEPVITSNAPSVVKTGSTLELTTTLTNTSLKNLKTADYDNPENYDVHDDYWYGEYREYKDLDNLVAYKPSVTVLEGEELVSQSNQDYSNTLTSSETLTFQGTGTVKLKIVYNQYVTTGSQIDYKEVYDPDSGDMIGYEPTGEYNTYNPEKIITINVTEDGKPPVIETPDKTDLQKLVSENKNIDKNSYTLESYRVFSEALQKAEAVLNNPDATETEISQAEAELETAIKALKPTKDETESLPSDGDENVESQPSEEDGKSDGEPSLPDGSSSQISGESDNTSQHPSDGDENVESLPSEEDGKTDGEPSLPDSSSSQASGESGNTSQYPSAGNDKNPPRTGGGSMIMLLVLLAAGSCIALTILAVRKRKNV